MDEDKKELWNRFNEIHKRLYSDVKDGDMKAFIYSFRRGFLANMGVEEFQNYKIDMEELLSLMLQIVGDHDPFSVVGQVDSIRLHKKSTTTICDSFDFPVLNAVDIDDGIARYNKCNAYVFDCWRKSLRVCKQGDYALAIFLSILALEEAAKFHQAWYELFYNDGKPLNSSKSACETRRNDYKCNHRKKHFVSVISGAMLNHRIERLFGTERVSRFVKMVDGGGLESVRQTCLYATLGDNGPVYPDDVVTRDDAVFYVLFCGEAIGEFIYATPWEYRAFKEEMDKEIEGFGLPVP